MEPKQRLKQLIEKSKIVDVENNISMKQYIRSGKEIVKKATSLEAEGEQEKAFLLYLRFITLFLEKVVKHPEYPQADSKEKENIKVECEIIFDKAEKLKQQLLEKFQSEYEANPNSD